MKVFWYALIAVLACGGFLMMCVSITGCSSTEARARNVEIGTEHQIALTACRSSAKSSDAGDKWALYTACADAADAKFGRKP